MGRGVFINEDLNREEANLAYLCRQARKKGLIRSTWTQDLRCYVVTHQDQKLEIGTPDHLDLITSTPLDDSGSHVFEGFSDSVIQNARERTFFHSVSSNDELY